VDYDLVILAHGRAILAADELTVADIRHAASYAHHGED
jgi:hypothetical protein